MKWWPNRPTGWRTQARDLRSGGSAEGSGGKGMKVIAKPTIRADAAMLRNTVFVMMALQIAMWGAWAPKLFPI